MAWFNLWAVPTPLQEESLPNLLMYTWGTFPKEVKRCAQAPCLYIHDLVLCLCEANSPKAVVGISGIGCWVAKGRERRRLRLSLPSGSLAHILPLHDTIKGEYNPFFPFLSCIHVRAASSSQAFSSKPYQYRWSISYAALDVERHDITECKIGRA